MPPGKVKKLWTVRKRSSMAGVVEVYENQRFYGVGWCAHLTSSLATACSIADSTIRGVTAGSGQLGSLYGRRAPASYVPL